jgi:hypothetical protein
MTKRLKKVAKWLLRKEAQILSTAHVWINTLTKEAQDKNMKIWKKGLLKTLLLIERFNGKDNDKDGEESR